MARATKEGHRFEDGSVDVVLVVAEVHGPPDEEAPV